MPGEIEDGDLDPGPRQPGDDEIAASVRRLLRMDASTNMLPLAVHSRQGVVTLSGVIQSLDDADNAAAVAARAPGVLEVVAAMDVS
jgi:osmotically-inducible protein OsmY